MRPTATHTWEPLARELTDGLIDARVLRSERWVDAFRSTPRHLFVPEIHTSSGVVRADHADSARTTGWLRMAYSDASLSTAELFDQSHRAEFSVSSSTRPSLMAEMLEELDVKPGMRVLEIGTGTGYNAALMARALGPENVYSVDIDPALVAAAEERLADLGYTAHLTTGDGMNGFPNAPARYFDRIIATCAVPTIPIPWIEQVVPGGKILANVRGEIAGGPMCLATRDPDGDVEAVGRFHEGTGHFMWSRSGPQETLPFRQATLTARHPQRTTADAGVLRALLAELDDPNFRFLLQLQMTDVRSVSATHDPVPTLAGHTIDGAHVHAEQHDQETANITQTGPRRLWDTLAATHTLWLRLGRPSVARYGIVVTPTVMFAHLDDEHGWTRWPLPLITTCP